jgi:hypothetical protein
MMVETQFMKILVFYLLSCFFAEREWTHVVT